MNKTCTICKQVRPVTEFNKHSKRSDGLQQHCRSCNRERSRAYYKRNPERHKQNVRNNNSEYRTQRRQWLKSYLKEKVCTDCGLEDWRVLEFDHLRDKTYGISRIVSVSARGGYDRMLEEIAKCEVVCANCHRLRTYARANSYRFSER